MRWLRYEANGQESYGIIEGDEVVQVTGDPFAGYEMTRTKHKLPLRENPDGTPARFDVLRAQRLAAPVTVGGSIAIRLGLTRMSPIETSKPTLASFDASAYWLDACL